MFGNCITRLLPANLSYSKGSTPLFSEDYAYDKNTNLTGVGDLVNGQNNQALGYDALDRLTSASAPNAWGNQTFAYDPLNRLRQYLTAGYTFNVNYDGNTFSRYASDPRGNRQATTYAGSTSYAFDAAGRRVAKYPVSYGTASPRYRPTD